MRRKLSSPNRILPEVREHAHQTHNLLSLRRKFTPFSFVHYNRVLFELGL